MAQHNANDKIFTAIRVKQEVIVAIHLASQVAFADLTWADFRTHCPDPARIDKELRSDKWRVKMQVQSIWSKRAASPKPSCPSTTSSSTESSDEPEADGLVAWFQQSSQGACHLVQAIHGTRLVPFCQDLPFDTAHFLRSAGLEQGLRVCRKCLARAPPKVQQACNDALA